MSAGPILIFDKSLLEALSPDEAVWLGCFYRVNMTPLFFVETLADLEKEGRAGRTPEEIVGSLAAKTSVMTVDANLHHSMLCAGDLDGARVEMCNYVVLGGGRTVRDPNGQVGIVYDQSSESKALHRWRRREFEQVEREHARAWRNALANLDLEATAREFKPFVEGSDRPKTLADVKHLVDRIVAAPNIAERVLGMSLQTLGVPYELWPRIFQRWVGEGKQALSTFAPYAAYALMVDLFLAVAMAGGLIAKERPSNKADIAYLYYLPFCMVFTSMDKLHRETVPLFLKGKQRFIWGLEMKAELRKLDEHYSAFPEDVKARGVMSFAHVPPLEGDFMTTRLWDEFMAPHWRKPRKQRPDPKIDPQERKRLDDLLRELNARRTQSQPADREVRVKDAAFVIVESAVPAQLGKWRIVPPEAAKDEN